MQMIEIEAKVMATEAGFAWIIQENPQLCMYCNKENGCKAIALTRLFCLKPRLFRVQDSVGVGVGEYVKVGMEERSLLQGAFLVYFLPLLTLIAGAVLGKYGGGEYGSIWGGAIGFASIFYGISRKNRAQDQLPIILERIKY